MEFVVLVGFDSKGGDDFVLWLKKYGYRCCYCSCWMKA